MKIKLTKKWHTTLGGGTWAMWHNVMLACCSSMYRQDEYWGCVSINGFERYGKIRRSKKLAMQDAEKLAVELLVDIRDGVKELMKKHGIEDDES